MAKRPKNLTFQKRVQERVKALGESPITLGTKVGLRREFIRDIVEGRKFSVGARYLTLVAKALQCDPRYLTGDIDQPMPLEAPALQETILAGPTMVGGAIVAVSGICWSGMWQSLGTPPRVRPVVLARDPRYPDIPQVAYRLEGVAMFESGRDAFVIGLATDHFVKHAGPIAPGTFVVLRRHSKEREAIELSVRLVEKTGDVTRLTDVAGTQPPIVLESPPKGQVLTIEAVVTTGTQLLM